MPRVKGLLEGKCPARDESRAVEPITLDAFFKAFKESTKKQDQRFDELTERMDVNDKRYKDEDRCFQEQEQPFQRWDEKSVEMKQNLRRNCKTGGLPGQQARPESEDTYRESGESEDDSAADGGKWVTPSGQLEKEPDLVQQTCISQQENNPVTISRHVESDIDGGSSPPEPTLRDLPHGENFNGKSVLQNAGVKDGETSSQPGRGDQYVAEHQQGRNISSQVAAVNVTEKGNWGAVRNRLVLQNKTANTTSDENKVFDPGGEQDWCALPSRPLPLSGRV